MDYLYLHGYTAVHGKAEGFTFNCVGMDLNKQQVMLLGENHSYKNVDVLLAANLCVCLAAILRKLSLGTMLNHMHLHSKLIAFVAELFRSKVAL